MTLAFKPRRTVVKRPRFIMITLRRHFNPPENRRRLLRSPGADTIFFNISVDWSPKSFAVQWENAIGTCTWPSTTGLLSLVQPRIFLGGRPAKVLSTVFSISFAQSNVYPRCHQPLFEISLLLCSSVRQSVA